jgi:CBS domain-containing protein
VLEIMGKMARHHVGQLPVVDGGELVGLVSVGDLIKALYEQSEAENQHLKLDLAVMNGFVA